MTQKTWIKVHTGLTNDPKHREAIGVRIWLFMALIDRADYESGMVWNYTDGAMAEYLDMNPRTVAEWRRDLSETGYIKSYPGDQCQHIMIMRWRNPRQVEAEAINIPGELHKSVAPPYGKRVPPPYSKDVTLTLDPQLPQSITQETDLVVFNKNGATWIFKMYQDVFKEAVNAGEHDALRDLAHVYTQADVMEAMTITRDKNARQRITRKVAYVRGILQDWAKNGKPSGSGATPAPLQRAPSLESLGYKVVR